MEDATRSFVKFQKGDSVALLVNNLGGLSVLELHVILDETVIQMSSIYGISPKRIFLGTYVSSVNGPGFSLTLLKLEKGMLPLLDRDTDAQAWITAVRRDDDAELSLAELPTNSKKTVFSKLPGK
jgi:dihydroxyacetone kinase